MQLMLDLDIIRLSISVENAFILNRNKKNRASCVMFLGSVFSPPGSDNSSPLVSLSMSHQFED